MVRSFPRSAMAAALVGYGSHRSSDSKGGQNQASISSSAPKPFASSANLPTTALPWTTSTISGDNNSYLHRVFRPSLPFASSLRLSNPAVRCEDAQEAGVLKTVRNFREKLSRGEKVIGVGIQIPGIMTADALAPCSGFFWFDQEHMLCNPQDLLQQMITARNKGVMTIVRVKGPNSFPAHPRLVRGAVVAPDGGSAWSIGIKNALDSGADGIVVPQVRTAEEVRGIVADCIFPASGGRRGFGPTIPLDYGRIPIKTYVKASDENVFIGVMIETQEAMDNLEEIASVPRLDCLVLGANDLSAALGVTDYNNYHPLVDKAIDRILDVAKRHGKWVMFSTRNPDMAEKLAMHKNGGAQILHIGHDILAMVSFQEKLVKDLNGKLKQ